MAALLQTRVEPKYPQEAKDAHIQGNVILNVIISTTGEVEVARLVTGDPLLAPAAIEAVKQWKYKPFLLNREPIEVDTQVEVQFRLSH